MKMYTNKLLLGGIFLAFLTVSQISISLSNCSFAKNTVKPHKEEWLFKLFPSQTNCNPNIFYDDDKKQSTGNILEKHGYTTPHLLGEQDANPKEGTAVYSIHETFLGIPATEFSIPRMEGGTWIIQVNAPASKVAQQINQITRKPVNIVENMGEISPPNELYIVKSGTSSKVVCFITEGED